MVKERNIGLELLRNISMMMVVALHILGHTNVLKEVEYGTSQYYISWIIESISFVSVNIYVLISGYFLYNSKFKIKKIVSIYLQVIFYTVGIYGLLVLLGKLDFSIVLLIKTFIPIITGQYWFITAYIVMYVFSPVLNIIINKLNKTQHKCINILLLLFACVIGTAFYALTGNTPVLTEYSSLWFITLYSISAYIKKYKVEISNKKIITIYFISLALMVLTKIIPGIINNNYVEIDYLRKASNILFKYTSITVVLMSMTMFMYFKELKIENKLIKKITLFFAPLTFGVYLIHENQYFKEILWDIFDASKWINSNIFVLKIIATVLCIFIVLSLIDYIRRKIFLLLKIDKYLCKLDNNKIDKVINEIYK